MRDGLPHAEANIGRCRSPRCCQQFLLDASGGICRQRGIEAGARPGAGGSAAAALCCVNATACIGLKFSETSREVYQGLRQFYEEYYIEQISILLLNGILDRVPFSEVRAYSPHGN